MRNYKIYLIAIFSFFLLFSCSKEKENETIEDSKLGIINANVESEETNLKIKPKYRDYSPGSASKINRSFENAPPMIPHTTEGFLPITAKNNICLSCHMPDKAKKVNAVPLPKTHFTDLRPDLVKKGNVFEMAKPDELFTKDLKHFNYSYFNCTQCHVPQTTVTVNIENLFTPEFRSKLGKNKSDLRNRIGEGIK